jgi:hypothetical protein
MSGSSDSVFTSVSNLYKKAGYLNLYGIDLIITLVICVLFSLIMTYYSVINNLQPIKADWDNNKCKPSVIPFAGIINKPDGDTVFEFTQKNFMYCGQSILKSIVDGAFTPIYLAFEMINNVFRQLAAQLTEVFNQLVNMQGTSSGIFGGIHKALSSMLIPLQYFIINVKDMINKIQGVIILLLYSLMGPLFSLLGAFDLLIHAFGIFMGIVIAAAIALASAAAIAFAIPFIGWPIGAAITPFAVAAAILAAAVTVICIMLIISINEAKKAANQCFDPNTKVKTQSGELIAMKDLELNTILKHGTRVVSVMKLNNIDEKGDIINKMYEIQNGEDNETIYVTGTHLVYDPIIKEFVAVNNLRGVNPSRISAKACPILACLITTNHTIPIGDWIFHDWEDNNGSSSKSVA